MQQAIPYRSWRPIIAHSTPTPTSHFKLIIPHSLTTTHDSPKDHAITEGMVLNMVTENAVIVFARRGCCMSHVVKRLLLGLGANPAVHEVEEREEVGVVRELEAIINANDGDDGNIGKVQFPAVFIGGKLFGGLDRLMASHISGELVPILKQAGALWL